jgi:hypothetical protein
MNNQDQFDNWTKQWEKAQADGVFKDAPKPPTQHATDFFGQFPTLDTPQRPDQTDAEYWRQVYELSRGGSPAALPGDPEVIQENLDQQDVRPFAKVDVPAKDRVRKGPTGLDKYLPKGQDADMSKMARGLSHTANPVYYYSYGKDQDLHVTPNWSSGVELEELHNIKVELEQLESKLGAAETLGKDTKKLKSQLSELKTKVDELSNSLTPSFLSDYMS